MTTYYKKTYAEIMKFRTQYRRKAHQWITTMATEVKAVAMIFTPGELWLLLAVYEFTPYVEYEHADLDVMPREFDDEDEEFDFNKGSFGLQHILALWVEIFDENTGDHGGVYRDWTIEHLMECTNTEIIAMATMEKRLCALVPAEAVALISMLEAARALPHGIRSYISVWTPKALLGIMARGEEYVPWGDEVWGHVERIDFDEGEFSVPGVDEIEDDSDELGEEATS